MLQLRKLPWFILSFVMGVLTCASSSHAQSSGSFLSTGNMTTTRAFHTATLLNNGEVLIAGGEGGATGIVNAISSAELYDPVTRSFVPTGPMTTARSQHTATLLPNGKVLITGGRANGGLQLLASAELYDPDSRTFATTGDMTVARTRHSATLLNNGKVLIVGGWEPSPPFYGLASAELYDPLTGTFTATGNMTLGWYGATATLLPDGKVLITSAYQDDADGPTAEVYDPFTGTFINKNTRTRCCTFYWQTTTLLPNATVLIAGGGSADDGIIQATAGIYDAGTGTFLSAGAMITPRYLHTSTVLSESTVLIAGFFESAEVYDSSTGSFSYIGNMVRSRHVHTATLLNNGTVLLAGGLTSTFVPTASAELFVPSLPVPALVVAELRFDRSSVTPGSSYSVNASGSDLSPRTFFDVRFTAPGGHTDVVLNWQRGLSAAHNVPAGTAPGIWTITGVRAHQLETDHTGNFSPVSATITVSP
jgi:hypothetical protein